MPKGTVYSKATDIRFSRRMLNAMLELQGLRHMYLRGDPSEEIIFERTADMDTPDGPVALFVNSLEEL